jgi:hypothetical protein
MAVWRRSQARSAATAAPARSPRAARSWEALQDLGRFDEAGRILESIPDTPFLDAHIFRVRSSSGPLRAVLLRLLATSPPGAGCMAPHRMGLLARLQKEDPEALAAVKSTVHDGDA